MHADNSPTEYIEMNVRISMTVTIRWLFAFSFTSHTHTRISRALGNPNANRLRAKKYICSLRLNVFYYFLCRSQTTSCKSICNHKLDDEMNETIGRDVEDGDLNFSWFSMILKNLSRNSKVALYRTELLVVRTLLHFILLYSVFVHSV